MTKRANAAKAKGKAKGNAVGGRPESRVTMNGAAIDRFGPPSVLTVHTLPIPVPIAETFPLERAAKAHARVARGHVPGRIALRIG